MKCLIIDELPMVASDLWVDINSRLQEIFIVITEKSFASLSVMNVGNYPQLPLVLGKFIFSPFFGKVSIKHLLGLQLWHLSKYSELIEAIRQNDKTYIGMLNKVLVRNVDDECNNYSKQDL